VDGDCGPPFPTARNTTILLRSTATDHNSIGLKLRTRKLPAMSPWK